MNRPVVTLAALVMVVAAVLVVSRIPPAIPSELGQSVARAEAAGGSAGGSDGPRAIAGTGCLDRLERGSGWVDLCWELYRSGADEDPARDYYFLRYFGSFEGLRWLAVRADLVGTPADNFLDGWPAGTYEGACAQIPVSLLVPMDELPPEDICGRTEGRPDPGKWAYDVAWRCESCLFPDSTTRAITLYAVVAVPEGVVPAWDLYATAGS